MNGYGLIAAIAQSIASLAWPAALVAIVWLFRRRLEDLLPKLQAKYKDFEISFRLAQAEKEAAALPPPLAPADPDLEPTPEERGRFEQIADISPRAAIMEMRRELEEALRGVAKEYDLAPRVPMSLASITRMLRSRELIDRHTSALLDDLRAVGNAAAHGSNETEFSKEDALRYGKLADEIISRLASKRVLIAESESREGSRSG
jgi:hypothetical protein